LYLKGTQNTKNECLGQKRTIANVKRFIRITIMEGDHIKVKVKSQESFSLKIRRKALFRDPQNIKTTVPNDENFNFFSLELKLVSIYQIKSENNKTFSGISTRNPH